MVSQSRQTRKDHRSKLEVFGSFGHLGNLVRMRIGAPGRSSLTLL